MTTDVETFLVHIDTITRADSTKKRTALLSQAPNLAGSLGIELDDKAIIFEMRTLFNDQEGHENFIGVAYEANINNIRTNVQIFLSDIDNRRFQRIAETLGLAQPSSINTIARRQPKTYEITGKWCTQKNVFVIETLKLTQV